MSEWLEKILTNSATWVVTAVILPAAASRIPAVRDWFSGKPLRIAVAAATLTSFIISGVVFSALRTAPFNLEITGHTIENSPEWSVIPGSDGAKICALSYVEHKQIAGYCQIAPLDGYWKVRNSGGNICGMYCLKLK